MSSLRAALLLSLVACAHPPRPAEEEPLPDLTSIHPRPVEDAGIDPVPAAVAEPLTPPEKAPEPLPEEVDVPDEPRVGRPALTELTPLSPLRCELPALELGATRWIARRLTTGTMPGPSHLYTLVLDVTGDRVTWTEFTQRAQKPGPPGPELPPQEWTCHVGASTVATVTRKTTRELVVTFKTSAETYALRCDRRRLEVAPAEALRKPLPQLTEECKRSGWATSARQAVDALVCHEDAFESRTVFGAAPGVEHVTMDEDDCGDPTLALRRIGPDGAVRTVRRLPAKR